jgi:hypothetical protein
MRIAAVGLACLLVGACAETPTQPRGANLSTGRWTGDGACLSAAVDGCDLVVGCGHGQFPLPVVRTDGTFDVNGTYRIEVGPISINPAPPATFFRRPEGPDADAQRDSQRTVAPGRILCAAADKRCGQVRGAVRLKSSIVQIQAAGTPIR